MFIYAEMRWDLVNSKCKQHIVAMEKSLLQDLIPSKCSLCFRHKVSRETILFYFFCGPEPLRRP